MRLKRVGIREAGDSRREEDGVCWGRRTGLGTMINRPTIRARGKHEPRADTARLYCGRERGLHDCRAIVWSQRPRPENCPPCTHDGESAPEGMPYKNFLIVVLLWSRYWPQHSHATTLDRSIISVAEMSPRCSFDRAAFGSASTT